MTTKYGLFRFFLFVLIFVIFQNDIDARDNQIFISIFDRDAIFQLKNQKRIKILIYNGTIDTLEIPEYFSVSSRSGMGELIFEIEKFDPSKGRYFRVENILAQIFQDLCRSKYFLKPNDFIVVNQYFDFFYDLNSPGVYRMKVYWKRRIREGTIERAAKYETISSCWREFLIE